MKSRNQGLKGKSKLQTGMILKATNGKILGILDGGTRKNWENNGQWGHNLITVVTDIYMAAYGNSKGKKDTPSEFEAPNV